MRLVVIDPGHGGSEQRGSSSPFGVRGPGGSSEKELTLALARRLRARLEPQVRVHLTRDRDENRSLAERAETARRLGAHAFLSLHGNGGPLGRRGSETWVHSDAAPSARRLADGVARALAPVLGPGRGVHSAPMAVLDPNRLGRVADACLVEVDCLTDSQGERHLNDAGALDDIAEALAGALHAHLCQTFPEGQAETIEDGCRRQYGGPVSYWPDKYPVIGMDVSSAQGKIDWNAVHGWKNRDGDPIRFCFMKASEYKVDDFFNRNWALACGNQRHEAEGVAAHIFKTLADAGTTVTKDEVKRDLQSVSDDGTYPYIDGGMGAISEIAAQVLVHAIRDGRVIGDLIAAVITKHGGSSSLGAEMVAASNNGTTIEPTILKEITDEAVAASPATDRAKLRARYDKLLKEYKTSDISYYFSPTGPDAGMVRSPYHFFHPSRSATDQAQRLFDAVEAAGGFRDEDLPPVIDFESDDGMTKGKTGAQLTAARTAIADALADCLAEVQRLFGRVPIIYTAPGLWDSYINPADSSRFANYPSWAARYDRGDNDPTSLDPARTPSHALGFKTVWTDPPSVPSFRPDWSFWQIRIVPHNEVDGVATTLDCDVFNGDIDALNALAAARPAAVTGSSLSLGSARRVPPRGGMRFGSGAHERYLRPG